MTDLYANWAQLAANETLNVDYRLPVRYNTSSVAHIAIHGGAIEPGTTELASSCAAFGYQNYYSVEGIKASNNSDLHITSTNFDEPTALNLVESSNFCFSFHGFTGTAGVAESYIGGLDTVNRDLVVSALQRAGFTASSGTQELNGNDPTNIVNKTLQNKGVQIEISNAQRALFFPSSDLSRTNRETGIRTDAFYQYVKAIVSVSNAVEDRPQQTSNYKFNKPLSTDKINDFETWLNANWDKAAYSTAPLQITGALPQSGPFNIGDRIYRTDDTSIYILICKDSTWGWFWRPVHAAISPWITVPNSVIGSGWTGNPDPSNPFAVALDNRGSCHWRGAIALTSGVMTPNVNYLPLANVPVGIRPRMGMSTFLGYSSFGAASGEIESARIFINSTSGQVLFYVQGVFTVGSQISKLYLDKVKYPIGNAIYDVA
jgi:phage replication-related protein YjqB (UPF0714/DUF867 family)